jgi:hypothetical protein
MSRSKSAKCKVLSAKLNSRHRTPRRLRFPVVAFIMTLFVLACNLPAFAQDTPATTPDPLADAPRGTVSGVIINGTAASAIPPDLSVSLVITGADALSEARETVASPDGRFSFVDVPIVTGYTYFTAVAYRDRVFSSAFAVGDTAVTALDLPITIYELTEDPAVLSIAASILQITASGDTMQVQQVFQFSNSSDRLFTTTQDVGDGRFASLSLQLPPGSQVIGFDNPDRYTVDAQNFRVIDTAPVAPGSNHLVVINYILPYDGSPALIEQPFDYPFAGQVRLLLTPDTLSISSAQLAQLEPQTIGDRVFNRAYGGQFDIQPGDVLRFELSGAPANPTTATSEASSDGGRSLLLTVMALTGVGLLVTAGVVFVMGNRRRAAAPAEETIDQLVQRIELLDRQHQAGQLNHDVWHRQRQALKERLDQLLERDE